MNVDLPGLPLAVDLDGTLILTDMSLVSFRKVIIRSPWILPGMLLKEFSGRRAEWCRALAEQLYFAPSDLESHSCFLDLLTG